MRTKLTRAGILFAALLGLLGATVPAAQATTTASATFTGTAAVPGGLGYPCTDPTKPCPPDPTVKSGNIRDFSFSSTVCVGTKTDIGKGPTKPDQTYGPNCVITAKGTLQGYCGLSLGTGLGTITWGGPPFKTVDFTFKYQSAGGTLVVTGTTAKGDITAVVNAVPVTGSCTTKSATGFLLTGDATIVNPT